MPLTAPPNLTTMNLLLASLLTSITLVSLTLVESVWLTNLTERSDLESIPVNELSTMRVRLVLRTGEAYLGVISVIVPGEAV